MTRLLIDNTATPHCLVYRDTVTSGRRPFSGEVLKQTNLYYAAMSTVLPPYLGSLPCVTPNRALLISEVLEMILDELANDKRSMSRLAFTCKAIAEPALDRLWTLNDSLEPYISLLPKELTLDVRLEGPSSSSGSYILFAYRKTLSSNLTTSRSQICPWRSGRRSTIMLDGLGVYMQRLLR